MKLLVRTVAAGGIIAGLLLCHLPLWADSPGDSFNQEIVAGPVAQSVELTTDVPQRGDVNMDGDVDMGDVIKLEREILEIEPLTEGADVNLDGNVDMGDVVEIERILLGISTRS